MTFLRIICLLSILVAAGASRECMRCIGVGDECDSSNVKECSTAEDICGSALIDTSISPFALRTIHKNCFSPETCELGFISLNIGKGVNLRARINCCPDPDCPVLPLPGNPLTLENGHYCPGCFGAFTHDCTEYPAFCRGSETKCIDIVGQRYEHIEHIPYNIKGCASSCPSLAVVNKTLEKGQNGLSRFTCTEAAKKEILSH